MQMFSVKIKIIIPVSQVAKDLTNHEYDAIIVRSFSIMDMNVKEKMINEISKVKISKATPTLPLKQCLWNALPYLNVLFSKKVHAIYGI